MTSDKNFLTAETQMRGEEKLYLGRAPRLGGKEDHQAARSRRAASTRACVS